MPVTTVAGRNLCLSACAREHTPKTKTAMGVTDISMAVLIYQPTIPAIDSLCAFPSEASARRIGNRVLERIKHNQNFSLTQEEIKQILSDR